MSTAEPKPIKVFVSYSWTTQEHEMRVLGWAERLRGDGVDVVLDKWDLKEGQDKNVFMEQMVRNLDITKVVVFSDAVYASKADGRKGGVGTESQIISKEIYEKVDQQKFIPVVCEYQNRKPCLPIFFGSRIYVDFSSPEQVNEEWDKLLRAIFDKPFFKKPPLGKPPSHILDDGGVASRSKGKLLAFRDALVNDKSSFRGLLTDFLDSFLESFEDYRIDFKKTEGEPDELIVASLNRFLPARDEFIEFALLLSNYRADVEFFDRAGDFFESALRYNWRPEQTQSYNNIWFENFRFFSYELLLYYVAALIKNRRYQILNILLHRAFLLPPSANAPSNTAQSFSVFWVGMDSMKYRNERLKLNRLDLVADLINQRATLKQLPFGSILQADVILFTAGLLDETRRKSWYPRTLIYNQYGNTCELFARAVSKQQFENIKTIFGVTSKEEFATKVEAGLQRQGVHNWTQLTFYSDVSWNVLLNLENLATTS